MARTKKFKFVDGKPYKVKRSWIERGEVCYNNYADLKSEIVESDDKTGIGGSVFNRLLSGVITVCTLGIVEYSPRPWGGAPYPDDLTKSDKKDLKAIFPNWDDR